MKTEYTEAVWLTDDHEFSLAELAELSGLSEAELRELVDYGAVTPINPDSSPWVFNGKCLLTVRTACRLRISFDLEPHGVALIVSLLDRIHELEAQLGSLRARLPHHTR
ncbi:MAG: chaperone modulator CbpM [Sulfuricaulis sp.]|nr:chaperone modulator CbpM [Sulfuricaulis sp.]